MDTETILTVADLRRLLATLPENFEVWSFNSHTSTFAPAVNVTVDKRNRSVNVWVQPEAPTNNRGTHGTR